MGTNEERVLNHGLHGFSRIRRRDERDREKQPRISQIKIRMFQTRGGIRWELRLTIDYGRLVDNLWIPACAGMTGVAGMTRLEEKGEW